MIPRHSGQHRQLLLGGEGAHSLLGPLLHRLQHPHPLHDHALLHVRHCGYEPDAAYHDCTEVIEQNNIFISKTLIFFRLIIYNFVFKDVKI